MMFKKIMLYILLSLTAVFQVFSAYSQAVEYYTITNLTEYNVSIIMPFTGKTGLIQDFESDIGPGQCLKIFTEYPLVKGFDEYQPDWVSLERRITIQVKDEEKDTSIQICRFYCKVDNYHITGEPGGLWGIDTLSHDFEVLRTGRPNTFEPCPIFEPKSP